MKHLSKILLLFTLTVFAISCAKTDDPSPVPPIPTMAEKTIFFYMVADNNLSYGIHHNAVEILRARNLDLEHNNVIIYLDYEVASSGEEEFFPGTDPQLIRLLPNHDYEVLETYPERNSSDKQFAKQVFTEVVASFPAKKFGIILSSHGNGWSHVPDTKGVGGEENPVDSLMLNIPTIANMLPTNCDFVLFDACLMSSMSVAYELRNNTENLLMSVYTVPGSGLNYEMALPMLLDGDYKGTINHFYFTGINDTQSVSMSWIKTAQLEALAAEQNRLFEEWDVTYDDLAPIIAPAPQYAPLQNLSYTYQEREYDFMDFWVSLASYKGKTNELAAIKSLFNATVPYQRATNFYEYTALVGGIEHKETVFVTSFCGITTYVPYFESGMNDEQQIQNAYYKTLQWYTDAGCSALNPTSATN